MLKFFLNLYGEKDASIDLDNSRRVGRVDKVEKLKMIKRRTWTQAVCLPYRLCK